MPALQDTYPQGSRTSPQRGGPLFASRAERKIHISLADVYSLKAGGMSFVTRDIARTFPMTYEPQMGRPIVISGNHCS
jgi:hypothetical protein